MHKRFHLHAKLLALVATIASLSAMAADPAKDNASRCEINIAILNPIWSDLIGNGGLLRNGTPPIPEELISGRPDRLQPMTAESLAWKEGWKGSAPAKDLITAWYSSRSSIAQCFERKKLPAKLRIVNEKEAQQTLSDSRGTASGPFILDISTPVVDKSGTHAFVTFNKDGNALGGRTQFYHLEKSGNRWKLVGTRLNQIS